jgi:hypothetical protein
VTENNYGEEKMLNVEKFFNVWVEVGSHSTSKDDGTITGPSQAPLC